MNKFIQDSDQVPPKFNPNQLRYLQQVFSMIPVDIEDPNFPLKSAYKAGQYSVLKVISNNLSEVML